MTQTTITKKQENKGVRGILELTGQMSQVLKQFEGIYHRSLPETDGLTVESWMEAHGVPRFVTTGKNPKKKGYTPALINQGWNTNMLLKSDNGKVMGNCIYKSVAAKLTIAEDEKEKAYRVFTKEEAEKVDGKPIKRYMQVQVEPTRWSVATILKGLVQSREYDKHEEKAEKSNEEWEAIEDVYIVRMEQGADGKIVRRIIKVHKENVWF